MLRPAPSTAAREPSDAATLHMDMWDAGSRLAEADNPQAWDRVVRADRIVRDNETAVNSCAQAAVTAGKAQPCRMMVGPTTK